MLKNSISVLRNVVIAASLLIVGGVIIFGIIATKNQADPYYPESMATPAVQVNPQIVQLGAELGLGLEQLREVHAQFGSSASCPNESYGCYDDTTDTIYLSPLGMTQDRSGVRTTLAHEYYHHVWQNMTQNQKNVFGASLLKMYSGSDELGQELRWRMEPYVDKGITPTSETFTNELHSIWCTEVQDTWLTPDSLAYCAKYIPYRNALISTIRP